MLSLGSVKRYLRGAWIVGIRGLRQMLILADRISKGASWFIRAEFMRAEPHFRNVVFEEDTNFE